MLHTCLWKQRSFSTTLEDTLCHQDRSDIVQASGTTLYTEPNRSECVKPEIGMGILVLLISVTARTRRLQEAGGSVEQSLSL